MDLCENPLIKPQQKKPHKGSERLSLERIDKWLSVGQYSRKEAKQLIKDGRVTINGKRITDPGQKVDPQTDEVLLNGEPFSLKKYIYIMLNKPQGVVSASRSPNEKNVVDLVPQDLKRNGLFPAGRLDKDTTGFVLITDDGAFAHNILSPKHHVEKTYLVTVESPLTEEGKSRLEDGLEMRDGTKFLPALVKEDAENPCLFEVKICEGKYHQIKRMFAAVGSPVVALKRTHIGKLPLDDALRPGEAREITREEIKQITE